MPKGPEAISVITPRGSHFGFRGNFGKNDESMSEDGFDTPRVVDLRNQKGGWWLLSLSPLLCKEGSGVVPVCGSGSKPLCPEYRTPPLAKGRRKRKKRTKKGILLTDLKRTIRFPMLSNVPQFIDVEDKIAGPLTVKQVLWFVGMGAVLFIVWTFFDTPTFFVASIPIILLFAIYAFYRPYNQSMLSFTIHSVMFFFRPKLYTWDRPGMLKKTPKPVKEPVKPVASRSLSIDEIRELAKSVDRGGSR